MTNWSQEEKKIKVLERIATALEKQVKLASAELHPDLRIELRGTEEFEPINPNPNLAALELTIGRLLREGGGADLGDIKQRNRLTQKLTSKIYERFLVVLKDR